MVMGSMVRVVHRIVLASHVKGVRKGCFDDVEVRLWPLEAACSRVSGGEV